MLFELINQYCSESLHVHLLCFSGNKSLGEPVPYLRSTISLTWANSPYVKVTAMSHIGTFAPYMVLAGLKKVSQSETKHLCALLPLYLIF